MQFSKKNTQIYVYVIQLFFFKQNDFIEKTNKQKSYTYISKKIGKYVFAFSCQKYRYFGVLK